MKRLLSKLCVESLLILTLTSTIAFAQVSVNVNANPNPFPSGSAIYISVNASWPFNSWSCYWPSVCRPLYVEVTITGSDGFYGYGDGWIEGQTAGSWYTIDDTPGQTMQATSYYASVTVYYWDFEMSWWAGIETGSGSAGVQPSVQLTISGDDTIWWFDGETSSSYPTSTTLYSSAGQGTTWSVVEGAGAVELSGSGAAVTVTSTGYSNDYVRIQATAPGYDTGEFVLTVRTPMYLFPLGRYTLEDSNFGYDTRIRYKVVDNFEQDMDAGADLNEDFANIVYDLWPGNNWTRGAPWGRHLSGAAFEDRIQGMNISTAIPRPTYDPYDTTPPIHEFEQRWYIGGIYPAQGRQVQTDTLRRNLGNAEHRDIRQ